MLRHSVDCDIVNDVYVNPRESPTTPIAENLKATDRGWIRIGTRFVGLLLTFKAGKRGANRDAIPSHLHSPCISWRHNLFALRLWEHKTTLSRVSDPDSCLWLCNPVADMLHKSFAALLLTQFLQVPGSLAPLSSSKATNIINVNDYPNGVLEATAWSIIVWYIIPPKTICHGT